MLTLGIETSCDETCVAIVRDGREVLCNIISSSKDAFKALAGVIPEEAARQQVTCMIPVLKQALKEADVIPQQLDYLAVTKGPGLLGSLLVGTTTARVLSSVWAKPLIGVHHTLGHLSSPWLSMKGEPVPDISFPVLTLSASGGHSDLWYRTSHTTGVLLGKTRDDAAGEAFDKGASQLGLPYPGGPHLAKLAERGDEHRFSFPSPLHDDPSLDFSFSGLKTALKYVLRDHKEAQSDLPSLAASYQYAICNHLTDRLQRALKKHADIAEIHLSGGVSANTRLRTMTEELCARHGITFRAPVSLTFCTDNAAMIAAAGSFLVQEELNLSLVPFETAASLSLTDVVARHI
ncbi:MAG: tRNA (adenosine(37)-N6)-threonylcarbamoyltransferase complex transferase subunit TsaD [Candidatus Peribacteraceae bacterium]